MWAGTVLPASVACPGDAGLLLRIGIRNEEDSYEGGSDSILRGQSRLSPQSSGYKWQRAWSLELKEDEREGNWCFNLALREDRGFSFIKGGENVCPCCIRRHRKHWDSYGLCLRHTQGSWRFVTSRGSWKWSICLQCCLSTTWFSPGCSGRRPYHSAFNLVFKEHKRTVITCLIHGREHSEISELFIPEGCWYRVPPQKQMTVMSP